MQMQTNELHHILLTILNLIDGINKRWELNEKKNQLNTNLNIES